MFRKPSSPFTLPPGKPRNIQARLHNRTRLGQDNWLRSCSLQNQNYDEVFSRFRVYKLVASSATATMTRTSTRRVNKLTGGLLLATEVSGSFLTLSNFQSISNLSLPLGCNFAYNSPMPGCRAQDFGNNRSCSSSCQRAILRVQTNIQQSCVLVSAGETSLLDQAQVGNLVAALCGNRQAPPESATSISRSPPRSFTRIPPDPTSTTSTTTATTTAQESSSSDTLTAAPVFTPTPTSTPNSSELTPTTFTPRQQTTATTERTQTLTSSSSTWSTSSSAVQTQPRGGGGSPFDDVPGNAAQLGGNVAARLFAVVSCMVGMYLL